jgi:hypothetical protein
MSRAWKALLIMGAIRALLRMHEARLIVRKAIARARDVA